MWEIQSKKSQRRYARAWIHPLPGDPPICKALAIPKHPAGSSESITMTRNPTNLAPENQFLLWRQELEARQDEQARKEAELRVQANQLREENERLRTQLEASRAERSWEPPRPFPPSRPGKGKEATTLDDIDLQADDELSSSSSPSRAVHHPPTPRRPTQEKGRLTGLTGPSELQGIGHGGNLAKTNNRPCPLSNMCPT